MFTACHIIQFNQHYHITVQLFIIQPTTNNSRYHPERVLFSTIVTNRKVAGSNPNYVTGIFHGVMLPAGLRSWGWLCLCEEWVPAIIREGKGDRGLGLTLLYAVCFEIWGPYGNIMDLARPLMGLLYLYLYHHHPKPHHNCNCHNKSFTVQSYLEQPTVPPPVITELGSL
jgi:hypothetical protein